MTWNCYEFGDCLEILKTVPERTFNMCMTSPPYWGLRDYGVDGQIGLEPTPAAYVAKLVAVFREVREVLRDDGTLWLVLGDSYHSGDRGSYRNDSHRWESSFIQSKAKGSHMVAVSPNRLPQAGLKDKDLVGIPWRVALALQADGWWLRSDIIWHKPNPMPSSVLDRCTTAHEYIFLFAKSKQYYFDAKAIAEPSVTRDTRVPYGSNGAWALDKRPKEQRHGGQQRQDADGAMRNRRDVWTVPMVPYKGAHFATFPTALVEPCILAGSPQGGLVLDPFFGSGTVGQVCNRLGRQWFGIELNPAYEPLIAERTKPCTPPNTKKS